MLEAVLTSAKAKSAISVAMMRAVVREITALAVNSQCRRQGDGMKTSALEIVFRICRVHLMAICAVSKQAPNAHLGWNTLIEISRNMQGAHARVSSRMIQDLVIALSLLGQKELLCLCERRAPETPPPCLTKREIMI